MALATSLDNLNAMMYALDYVARKKCLKKGPGITYKEEPEKRMYPCPKGLKDCIHGKCIVTNKKKCNEYSQLPFNPVTGEVINGKACKTNADCHDDSFCNENKCILARRYLEFRDGKCLISNDVLRKWCSFPSARRTTEVKGVTDVPPFKYDTSTGKCSITKKYCDWMGVSFRVLDDKRGDCYSKTGQKIGEFFLGKTLFRQLAKFSLVNTDFAGSNVNLYMMDSKLGFSEAEVLKAYPELFKNNVFKTSFSRQDLQHTGKKRIFFITKNSDWISPAVIKAIKKKDDQT